MKLKTLSQINVKNKYVLLRIDINSPVVKSHVLDNPRFKASSKTLEELLEKGAKVAILAHQGRKGDKDFLSLTQHAVILSKYVDRKIKYVDDLFGEEAKETIKSLKSGEGILLKNVRAYPEEADIKRSKKYKSLCALFDFYVNDAFSVSHREQGSIILPPKYLSSAIGLQFAEELNTLEKFTKTKSKSKVFILGGVKVEDYLPIFNYLKNKNNKILIAGVLGNLLLIIEGYNLGYEPSLIKKHTYSSLMIRLRRLYKKYHNQIILPIDFAWIAKNGRRFDATLDEAPFIYKICDIGNKTVNLFKKYINEADYIFMKGPLGLSELPAFSFGTREILTYLAYKTRTKKVFTLLGGGHLTSTLAKYKIQNTFSYISLSGGALISYISGEKLPGIEALKKSRR